MIITYLILAAPIVAAALFWGSWTWMAVAVVVALIELLALQRSQRFSARFWRTIGAGRRSRRERAAERVYVAAALAGGALLVAAMISYVG